MTTFKLPLSKLLLDNGRQVSNPALYTKHVVVAEHSQVRQHGSSRGWLSGFAQQGLAKVPNSGRQLRIQMAFRTKAFQKEKAGSVLLMAHLADCIPVFLAPNSLPSFHCAKQGAGILSDPCVAFSRPFAYCRNFAVSRSISSALTFGSEFSSDIVQLLVPLGVFWQVLGGQTTR